jgi:hypothetical protein
MVHDDLFDLDRRDILPARDDHVLAAVAELYLAVGVDHADVPGPEPAVRGRGRGRLRIFQVAEHEVVAAQCDLPGDGAVSWDVGTVVGDTPGVNAIMFPTPWRAFSRACASVSSPSHSGRQSHNIAGP